VNATRLLIGCPLPWVPRRDCLFVGAESQHPGTCAAFCRHWSLLCQCQARRSQNPKGQRPPHD